MKILWVTNVELNQVAISFGNNTVVGGWLEQTAECLSKQPDIELSITSLSTNEYENVIIDDIHYYSFKSNNTKVVFQIIEDIQPDIIHIWGTEYKHTYEVMKYLKEQGKENKVIISIQGLVSYIQYHYFANLPCYVIHHRTIKEFFRPNIYQAWKKMKEQGECEKKALQLSKYCIGRTEWDHACAKQINPDITYFKGNENLRKEFYNQIWDYNTCEKHTIFFSQASYSIKGFHFMIKALPIIKEDYPDTKLYVLGENPWNTGIKGRIKESSYQWYLKRLIKKYQVKRNIIWLGRLNANEMVKQYCKANVFVCASCIENSSNSICEAMLLGVPIVASDVGGVNSLMENGKEGLTYHDEAFYMMADKVKSIFSDRKLAIELGHNAHIKASITHDVKKNMGELLNIYTNVTESAK